MSQRFGFSSKSKRLAVVIAGLLILSVVGVALAAPLAIDTFNGGTLTLGVNSVAPTTMSAVDTDASALGGDREGVLTWLSGAGTATLKVNDFGTQRLNFNQDNGVAAQGIVRWDGLDAQATVNNQNLGADLTDGGTNSGLHIEVVNDDIPIPLILRVYSGAGNYSTYTLYLPGGILSPGVHVDFFIPFGPGNGWVITGAGATFSAATAVEVEFDGTTSAGADVSIDLFEADSDREYGDLPASGDEVTGAADYANSVLQANHLPQGLRLGRSVDVEETPQPDIAAGSTASGDDNSTIAPNPFDDEDGVTVPTTPKWSVATGGRIRVTVNGCTDNLNGCYVNGWIDFNNNGSFADAGEQILVEDNIFDGTNQVRNFAIPAGTSFTNTFYARFRICPLTGQCNSVTAQNVANGEVEDYRWNFGPLAVTLNSLEAKADAQNNTAALILAATVVVALGLAGVALRRRTA